MNIKDTKMVFSLRTRTLHFSYNALYDDLNPPIAKEQLYLEMELFDVLYKHGEIL